MKFYLGLVDTVEIPSAREEGKRNHHVHELGVIGSARLAILVAKMAGMVCNGGHMSDQVIDRRGGSVTSSVTT